MTTVEKIRAAAGELQRQWDTDPRWKGIKRTYTAEDVIRLRGSVKQDHTLAKLGQPEIALGIIPGAGGTQRLPRLVGPAKAKDLVFTGRHVSAAEALTIGLVDEVVPGDDVYDAAVRWCGQFVDGPAVAIRAAKQSIDDGLDVDLGTGLSIERREFSALFATEDRLEGMTAFSDKRKPQFRGR